MAPMDTLVAERAFLEGPRWHTDPDGRSALYVSDMHGHEVLRVSLDGDVDVVAALDTAPSGLGWLPDGRMLIVSMDDRKLLRLDGGGRRRRRLGRPLPEEAEHRDADQWSRLVEAADCSRVAPNEINDMVVDRHGHAFISQFGFDFHGGAKFRASPVLRVDPDGTVSEATHPLRFANGMVITSDERTLIVAESAGTDLVGFDLADDGTLSNPRVWAELTDVPDGIAIDADDGVWIASPVTDRCVRVVEGGEVTDVVEVPGRHAIACAIGGEDGSTLFVCTSPTVGEPEKSRDLRGAKIEATRVLVPGHP